MWAHHPNGADMSSSNRIERDRGIKESHRQLAVLRDKWPLAFPLNVQDIRPLAIGSTRDIAAAMSWSLPYTLGVLLTWKMAPVYCEAVLRHDQRIDLDGALAEPVEAQARELATKRLAQLAERKAAKKAAKAAAPTVVTPKPLPTPRAETPATQAQLRSLVRASLLRRSA
jgi:sRNA-binding protein